MSEIEGESQVIIKEKLRKPDRYRVILHNDDYTTMDFVVDILCRVFHKTLVEAKEIMLQVHQNGRGECGVYTYEVAESKAERVISLARQAGFPLNCTLERE